MNQDNLVAQKNKIRKSGFTYPENWDLKDILTKLHANHFPTISKWIEEVVRDTIIEYKGAPNVKLKLYTFQISEEILKDFSTAIKKAGFSSMAEFWRSKFRQLLKKSIQQQNKGEIKIVI